MSKERIFKAIAGAVLSSVALAFTLNGCLGYVDQPGDRYARGRQSARFQPSIVEDYVYYPGYQTYYGSRTHQYYYQDGPSWVARPAPQGVSLNVLVSAPSVQM